MLTTKIRTIIVGAVAVAALSPGVASAMTVVHKSGTVTVKHVSPPIRSAARWKEAGSAGISGYDDGRCEGLLNDYNTAVNYLEGALVDGNDQEVASYGEQASKIEKQLTGNCLVVY